MYPLKDDVRKNPFSCTTYKFNFDGYLGVVSIPRKKFLKNLSFEVDFKLLYINLRTQHKWCGEAGL